MEELNCLSKCFADCMIAGGLKPPSREWIERTTRQKCIDPVTIKRIERVAHKSESLPRYDRWQAVVVLDPRLDDIQPNLNFPREMQTSKRSIKI